MAGKTLTAKILATHLVDGEAVAGTEAALRIDNTLTQDATGTMAYLQFEAIGIDRVRTEASVSFVDHNTLQTDFRNADDHRFLQSIAARFGLHYSRPGNGICHQVFLERFAKPGNTLIGSDSHTPTAGGIGCFAMGAGGLDVACAMAGAPFRIKYPVVVGIRLIGQLSPWVSAKDVILELLRRVDVKGNVGKVFEFFGEGVASLSVPDRSTITNMGTETGCTTSLFPSDDVTRAFLAAQGREADWKPLAADPDAQYDDVIEIDLSKVEPMVALPHSPGSVRTVREVGDIPVQQVAIGSCTNSSLRDLKVVAGVLKDRTISPDLHVILGPGSRQVVEHLVASGEFNNLVRAGVRIAENACGACIGMGAAPPSGANSVRTFNRNFEGRSGTKDANVYLVSPETAVATALTGRLTDPRTMGEAPQISMPEQYLVNDNLLIAPLSPEEARKTEILRGPNIAPLPSFPPLEDVLSGEALLKVGDNITTDHIMPAGAKVLPLRSNIPLISRHVFEAVDPLFHDRALSSGGGFIIGGENYGQGSSREHAALAPKYLGVKAVVVKSFARIHLANLINFGIVPLTFAEASDYETVEQGDRIRIEIGDLHADAVLVNETRNLRIPLRHTLSDLDAEILKAGGKLPWIKKNLD